MSSLFPVSGKNNRAVPQARWATGVPSMADLLSLRILQGRIAGRRRRRRGSDSGSWLLAEECRRRLIRTLVLHPYTQVKVCINVFLSCRLYWTSMGWYTDKYDFFPAFCMFHSEGKKLGETNAYTMKTMHVLCNNIFSICTKANH